MYDIFLKYFRDELLSEKITSIHKSKIQEFHNFVTNNLPYITRSPESKKYFKDMLRYVVDDLKRLLAIRVAKRVLNAPYSDDTIDKKLFEVIDKLLSFYTGLIAGLYITYDDKILVKTLKEFNYMNSKYSINDTFFLNIDDALIFFLKGYIKPIMKPYYDELFENVDEQGIKQVS